MKFPKFLFVIAFFSCSIVVYPQQSSEENENKTFVGKGLAEIDNVATKAWKEFLKLFKKRPFAYKNKRKHETKVKKHNAPDNYVETKKIQVTDRDSFLLNDLYKDNSP